MKKIMTIIAILLITMACSKSDSNYYSPYLPSQSVYFSLDLRNPEANSVRLPNGIFITYNAGISGIAIYNSGGHYFAYELTCPNHEISYNCSILKQKKLNDIFVYCTCKDQHGGEEAVYSLINGQPMNKKLKYQLKPYPVYQRGDFLEIRY
ncbi:Rieske (2Fe-2S) protein [Myroides injenensis]|uniref:Rieske (2Fe-2S) protein n=1 Tax=Myroides injenensis TaxID=1183151 RepID=UPI00028A3784|nr:hypothetical protein [Myroides injenensis]